MGDSPKLVQLGGAAPNPKPAVPGDTLVSVELAITGMTCAGCAHNVEQALGSAPGVALAQVNFATRRATIRYSPAQMDPARLAKAVRDAGYGVAAPVLFYCGSGFFVGACKGLRRRTADMNTLVATGTRAAVLPMPSENSRRWLPKRPA